MAPPLESGVYFIQNNGTKTVITLSGGSNADNTKIQGFAKQQLLEPASNSQLWVISLNDGDTYFIQNVTSRTFMDIPNNSVANQTPIVGYHETESQTQRWVLVPGTGNNAAIFGIRNASTGTWVDLYNGGSADGTAINGWSGDDKGGDTPNPHQQWRIIRS